MNNLLQLPLVVGKDYVTRDGIRARVVADDMGGDWPILVVYYHVGESPVALRYGADGNYSRDYTDAEDLVGPWADPPKPLECWSVYTTQGEPVAQFNTEIKAKRWAGSHPEFTIKHMREVIE